MNRIELYKLGGKLHDQDLLVLQEFLKVHFKKRKLLKSGETMSLEEKSISTKKENLNNFVKSVWISS